MGAARGQGLSRRGLHRTALEVAKLLLAMDERDPLGMLLYIDFLAVCAGVGPARPPPVGGRRQQQPADCCREPDAEMLLKSYASALKCTSRVSLVQAL